jgi:hypothetical protein
MIFCLADICFTRGTRNKISCCIELEYNDAECYLEMTQEELPATFNEKRRTICILLFSEPGSTCLQGCFLGFMTNSYFPVRRQTR